MTLSRRDVLAASIVGASTVAGIGDAMEDGFFGDSSYALAPWHTWGTSQTMVLDGSVNELPSQQLVKINYGRPENWRFLFAAQLEDALGVGDSLEVDVDLIVGLGRSFVKLPNFWVHVFNGAATAGIIVWDTHDTSPSLNELIVAQDLQCSARLRGTFNPALTKRLTISAFFAPNVHIRPEWFRGGDFRGGEDNGT